MSDNVELMQRFHAAATKFIEAADSAPHLETEVFLANVSRTMAELYSNRPLFASCGAGHNRHS
jgi:hypothetical protein